MKEQHTIADYLRYNTNDFLTDEYFQEWVKYQHPETIAFWQQLLQQHPEKKKEIEEAYELLLHLRFSSRPPGADRASRMWQYIDAHTPEHKVRRINLRSKWMLAAASIIFIISFGIWEWSREHYIYLTTINSEISTIILPDNSAVILNANSRLKYARDFGTHNNRELWIEGEAFFTVQHHTNTNNQPPSFVVHTSNLDVQVTGTTFNVYTRRQQTRVVLNHGGVVVHFKDKQLAGKTMLPGNMLEYTTQQLPVLHPVDTLLFTSWKMKRFLFANTTLKEVAQIMEDFYGCKVIFKDPELASLRITADMDIPNITMLDAVLSQTLNIRIQKDGDTLILQKKI
jgi:transmembrane sensor